MSVKYVHTNIIAKDWKALADFYIKVFDCKIIPPVRDLSGDWLDKLTKIKNCRIKGVHLELPGCESGPTLEIFSYEPENLNTKERSLNGTGLAHTAFLSDDVGAVMKKLKDNGGSVHGELAVHNYGDIGILTVVYARDPEGNFIEIQHWDKP
jgi:predicted enzyme related to lactoylglutathione lyase